MIIFWILAVGLAGLALLFVLPPLFSKHQPSQNVDQDALNLAVFRQQLQELDSDLAAGQLDQQQYRAARRDLERELLYDVDAAGPDDKPGDSSQGRLAAGLLGIAVPAAAVSLYLYLGDSSIIPRLEVAAGGQQPATHQGVEGTLPPMEVLVQRLAEKLKQDPDNLEGWVMLGRTYFAIGQPEQALHAMEKAYGLESENPDVLVAYAEAVAANNGNALAGRPAELIRTALTIDPQHTSARWLEGLVSFQGAEYARAAEQWDALAAAFDPGSKEAAELQRHIAEARDLAGVKPEPTTEEPPNRTGLADAGGKTLPTPGVAVSEQRQAATPAEGVTLEVSLAKPLWPEADINDSLFIYAKAVAGPPMPLAAHHARVQDLPLTIILDDSMAITPAMKLSGFDEVTVGARISKSGQATPQSGDLEGEVSPVKTGQAGTVQILIDRVRP